MGEVSDNILSGISCQECGVWMDDMFTKDGKINKDAWENPPGHPRTCKDCKNANAN